MAKCWFCNTRKGKRYCSPLENLLCPVCCAKNRLEKVECNEDCRYLSGVSYQKNRGEEKEFAQMMEDVPHGQFDDILQDMPVAAIAAPIETLVCEIYKDGAFRLTDKLVFETYKKTYQSFFSEGGFSTEDLDEFTAKFIEWVGSNLEAWQENLKKEKIGQIFIRLMRSIKSMSGGAMGEFGYLNYLKNTFEGEGPENGFIIEDKFGNKIERPFL